MKKVLSIFMLCIATLAYGWGGDILQSNSRVIMIENTTDIELVLKTNSQNYTRPRIIKPNFVGLVSLWTPSRYYISATNKDFHIIGTEHYITDQKKISISIHPDPKQGRLVLSTSEIIRTPEDKD